MVITTSSYSLECSRRLRDVVIENKDFGELIAQYDTDEVIAGEACTNRVVLEFEGNRLDLSGYEADKVIAMEDNRVVLQFSSEAQSGRPAIPLQRLFFVLMDAPAELAQLSPGAEGIRVIPGLLQQRHGLTQMLSAPCWRRRCASVW